METLSRVLPAERPLALHEPELGEPERRAVADCVDSGFVSSVGESVARFEDLVAAFTGSGHAIATVNGTAALSLALAVAGVRPGDEVIIPALSFVGTANAVAHLGAIPHFADVDESRLGLDPVALGAHLDAIAERDARGCVNRETGARIAAIVPMHAFGHPVAMAPLLEVARRHGAPVVEDAAEALGSRIAERAVGTIGDLGIYSFNGNKVITTGGGGMVVTSDADLAERVRHLATTAKVPHRWAYVHDEVGWNHRMPSLNAALGCAQMARLPDLLARKRAVAHAYRDAFAGSEHFAFVAEPAGTTSSYWLSTVRIIEGDAALRDAVLEASHDAGLQCRPAWHLLSDLPMYAASPRAALPVATILQQQLISLPSSARLARA